MYHILLVFIHLSQTRSTKITRLFDNLSRGDLPFNLAYSSSVYVTLTVMLSHRDIKHVKYSNAGLIVSEFFISSGDQIH